MYNQLEEPNPCSRQDNGWLLKIFAFLLGLAAAGTIFILIYYSTLLKSEKENTVLLKFEKMLERQNQSTFYAGF